MPRWVIPVEAEAMGDRACRCVVVHQCDSGDGAVAGDVDSLMQAALDRPEVPMNGKQCELARDNGRGGLGYFLRGRSSVAQSSARMSGRRT